MDVMVLAIFVFTMIGCGISSYVLGKRDGITATISHLVNVGLLELEDEE